MRSQKQLLVDNLGGFWMLLGAGLVTAPAKVMKLAGLDVAGSDAEIISRILGLRDVALGAAVLSTGDVSTRRRILYVLAAMNAVELAMIGLFARRLSTRSLLSLGLGTGANVAGVLLAATCDEETPSTGVPLLAAGYLLSTAPSIRLFEIIRRRDARAFAACEAGAALVSLGWLRRGNTRGAALNGFFVVAAGAAWGVRELRLRRGRGTAAAP